MTDEHLTVFTIVLATDRVSCSWAIQLLMRVHVLIADKTLMSTAGLPGCLSTRAWCSCILGMMMPQHICPEIFATSPEYVGLIAVAQSLPQTLTVMLQKYDTPVR
jgi:hypothetical protein